MIYELERYQNYIRSIIRRIPILKTEQLKIAMRKTFKGINADNAAEILTALQRRGDVLLSPDGWAMSKGGYKTLTGDKFNERLLNDLDYRLPKMSLTIRNFGLSMDVIDCFWVAIDMMPSSNDFVINTQPFVILFDTDENKDEISKVYEITKIPKSREDSRCELLRQLAKISDKGIQERTVRIALIEDENHAWMIPHIGFSYICVLDEKEKSHVRIIEKRDFKEAWNNA